LVEPVALTAEISQKSVRHASMRASVEVPQCIHHLVHREWAPYIGRLPKSGLAFNRMSIRGPGGQDGTLHLRLELGMMNDVQGVLKMGEGHCVASFLPILFLSRPITVAT